VKECVIEMDGKDSHLLEMVNLSSASYLTGFQISEREAEFRLGNALGEPLLRSPTRGFKTYGYVCAEVTVLTNPQVRRLQGRNAQWRRCNRRDGFLISDVLESYHHKGL
jgi:hypothetical protein